MDLALFDYDLPEDRIAQRPSEARERSRLLLLDRRTGAVGHGVFEDVVLRFEPGDVLVLNDTKVFPARLRGARETGGRVEALLLEERAPGRFAALLQARRKLRAGETVDLEGGAIRATLAARDGDAWIVDLEPRDAIWERIEACGRTPLPPYIRRGAEDERDASDRARYQTVYARERGAVAAPTAGLHFTDALLDALRSMGVRVATLTLHVGAGTFLPVRTERLDDHVMHFERFAIPEATAALLRAPPGRVVACGTTTVRALEHWARTGETSGATDLFIREPFDFRVTGAMITNFHLPRSTLLALVCAFAGRERVLAAYREAIALGYRFYSFGDAMWIG